MKRHLILLPMLIFFVACSGVKVCKLGTTEGNLGGTFNSELQDFSPFIHNNVLYYHRLDEKKGTNVQVLKSQIIDGVLSEPIIDSLIPFLGFASVGSHFIASNPINGQAELYFSASIDPKNFNSDIFRAIKTNDGWSKPQPINNVNTEFFEAMPFVSYDGQILIFTSDKPTGFGGLDIYISIRNEDGSWAIPRNAGAGINTEFDEINPTFLNNQKIIYSSNREGNYNLYGADLNDKSLFGNSFKLKAPVNSNANDFSGFVREDMIYITSDRLPSCGGKDLFELNFCRPVVLDINVISESRNFPLDGSVRLLDSERNLIVSREISGNSPLTLQIFPNKTYYVQYFNKCIPQYVPEQKLVAPCSDSSVIKLRTQFIIPKTSTEFDLEIYKVPFFVTGYYRPNTPENLESLRLKFAYNLIGKNDSTKYIEKPRNIYDEYAIVVEKALTDAINFINTILDNIDEDCNLQNISSLRFNIIGWADPRPLSPIATFADDDINDSELGIYIKRGSRMDNELLSKLRAYYTAKYLDKKLMNNKKYIDFRKHITWSIEGRGVDQTDLANELKRRVSIEIGVFDN